MAKSRTTFRSIKTTKCMLTFRSPRPGQNFLGPRRSEHLRKLREPTPSGQVEEELGVYRGYFRYDLKRDLQARFVAIAVGIQPPVTGVQIEMSEAELGIAEIPADHGQKPGTDIKSGLEEAYLAQRIFHGEMGRYAKTWSELARVTSFQFQHQERLGQAGQVPFGDPALVLEIDAHEAAVAEQNSLELVREPSSEAKPLEIEPVFSEVKK